MALHKRIPCPSLLLHGPPIIFDPTNLMPNLTSINFDTLYFPAKQTYEQFLGYWTIIWTKLLQATDKDQADAAAKAAEAWASHYHVDGLFIRLHRKSRSVLRNEGSNAHPHVTDANAELAKRAMRAARLGPDARASDVSKALRKGQALPLSDLIITQLSLLYPPTNASFSPTLFNAPPVPSFSANRNSVACAVLSRSPNSHPGKLGISFGILQLFCQLTYKREEANSPDLRWTSFCCLISRIMSGNALALAHLFRDVVGVFFDKNFEKPGALLSLRNIGIEESLLRISSALIFQEAIHDATHKGHLSCWELGCGVKNGAEIFGRIAAVAASHGMLVSVFDVEKAFNNLQRSDVKNAVENVNNPLLSAFISFLFAQDPTVTFKDHNRQVSFTLMQGILQGNPLSTFIFSLTICWILKPFRAQYPLSITPSFVDDLQLIGKPSDDYPPMLLNFLTLFRSHGLKFDLSNDAKSSIFSVLTPSPRLLLNLLPLGVKTQQSGIAPCKIPYGDPNFIATHVTKQQDKLLLRVRSFKALWPALLKLKSPIRNLRIGVHEGYINLLRLSLLSMTTYTLRTVPPLLCAPYASLASTLSLELIELVFPPRIYNIGNPLPLGPHALFPPLMEISRDIMQLPLALGGLSLRLPNSIASIAYVASCGECVHYLHAVASRLGFSFDSSTLPGLTEARDTVSRQLSGYLLRKPDEIVIFERSAPSDSTPLQESLTSLFNHAQIVRIAAALDSTPIYSHAFLARVDKDQRQCSWPFNPIARRNHNLAALADEDFSRAIQIAVLRPITAPRLCDCGATIDPVGLHFLSCRLVHFGYLHDCVKTAIAATIKALQPLDLAPLSVKMEVKVSRFYPLRPPLTVEGPEIIADIAVCVLDTSQHVCVIADVSSVLARDLHTAPQGFLVPLRARSKAKITKYRKYDIPVHLFHPVTVGRTNVLSRDAVIFCDFVGKFFPTIPKASDRIKAAISRAISVGAARTLNTALKRAQLASFNGLSFSGVPKSAACSHFRQISLPSDGVVHLRAASYRPPPDVGVPLTVLAYPPQGLLCALHPIDVSDSIPADGLNHESVGVDDC